MPVSVSRGEHHGERDRRHHQQSNQRHQQGDTRWLCFLSSVMIFLPILQMIFDADEGLTAVSLPGGSQRAIRDCGLAAESRFWCQSRLRVHDCSLTFSPVSERSVLTVARRLLSELCVGQIG